MTNVKGCVFAAGVAMIGLAGDAGTSGGRASSVDASGVVQWSESAARATLAALRPGAEIAQAPAIDETRRRAEDLGRAASGRLDELMPSLQKDRIAQAQVKDRPAGPGPKSGEESDYLLGPVLDWLDRAQREYQQRVIKPLSDPPASAQTPAPATAPSTPPAKVVMPPAKPPVEVARPTPPPATPAPPPQPPVAATPKSPPPPAVKTAEGDSILDMVQSWIDRSNRDYQDVIVKKLSEPTIAPVASAPIPPKKDSGPVVAVPPVKPELDRTADARKAEEARRAEEERKTAEARRAEEARKAEEAKRAEERRIAEARKQDEERRLTETKRAEDARKVEDAKKTDEARKAEEARRVAETKRAEDARKAEEARRTEEARRAEERRVAETKRVEDARKADEAKKAEDARRAEERRIAEAKRMEDARKASEAKKAADALRRAAQAPKDPANVSAAEKQVREAQARQPKAPRVVEEGSATRPAPPQKTAQAGKRGIDDRERSSLETKTATGAAVPRPQAPSRTTKTCKNAGRWVDPPATYVVKRGDTLWGIAERFYDDGKRYPRIYRANKGRIEHPDRIEVCQKIWLPARRGR